MPSIGLMGICRYCGRTGRRAHIGSHERACVPNYERLLVVLRAKGFTDVGDPLSCWLPTHTLGRAKIGGKRAHITAFEATYGPVSLGCVVCHACDVGNCVNPEHLWEGTQADNIHDMWAKGRGVHAGWMTWSREQREAAWDVVRARRRGDV